jgi:hypothetical protein
MIYKITTLILMLITSLGCSDTKQAVTDYSGDGEAKYLERPGLLGVDGVSIEMPRFNMMAGLDTEYDLSGIPPGSYVIYLTVPLSHEKKKTHLDLISKGQWSFSTKKNGEVVSSVSGILDEMTNNQFSRWVYTENTNKQWTAFNRFYPYSYETKVHRLSVANKTNHWSISVTFTNEELHGPIEAYIQLQRGGTK